MLKCHDVAQILTDERELSFPRKIGLKFHLIICDTCRSYQKSLQRIADLRSLNFERFKISHQEEIKTLNEKIKHKLDKKP